MLWTRRDWLRMTGAALVGSQALACTRFEGNQPSGPIVPPPSPKDPRKILMFTKSSGFEHSVIRRGKEGELGLAEQILTDLGSANNYQVTVTKDGSFFEPDQIGEFDAFVFYTTGDLTELGRDKNPPMSSKGLEAFFTAIEEGKGFLGVHSATDTFHGKNGQVTPFTKLIGGEFAGHGPQQNGRLIVHEADFPGIASFAPNSEIVDEWYAQKNMADDLRVLITQVTEGLQGNMYRRPNFPQTWIRSQGKGRVFYTSMGHREDVWENPNYQSLVLGGLGFVTGLFDFETTPNASQVTPGYQQIAS